MIVLEAPASATEEECDAFLLEATGVPLGRDDLIVRLNRFSGGVGLRLVSEQEVAG